MHVCLGTTPTIQQTMIFAKVVTDEVNRAAEVRRAAAGKPVNVGRVLHTLGEDAIVCVPLGGDTGNFIAHELTVYGVQIDAVPAPHSTRTCVTVIDQATGTVTELVEEHAAISPQVRAAMLGRLQAHLPNCRSLVLSGTLAPGAGEDFYAECCRLAAALPIVLDAKGEALMRALPQRPLIVKPNRAELAATMAIDPNDDAALRRVMIELVRRGAGWVIITMGKRGAIISDGKSFWQIAAIDVPAISPIGSGDAFSAGLASAVAAGRDVPDACRLAAACAAANTLIPGAGFLHLQDVKRLEPLAKLTTW
jgi:tagatose 6-phosphate kinase